jgi:hypothetical protein
MIHTWMINWHVSGGVSNPVPKLSLAKLERHLYSAADRFRQEGLDAATYKDYIFGLLFLKRSSDVFETEREKVAERNRENPDFYNTFFLVCALTLAQRFRQPPPSLLFLQPTKRAPSRRQIRAQWNVPGLLQLLELHSIVAVVYLTVFRVFSLRA